ncbi:Cytochrome P450 76T24 [Camellia lanceoleosa]|uniref:Cytochrome P450 76T24 n=1 Tax=Camellia lanceoleosa TaxID=1840588 RepID=A0ACC0FZU3_9ERIC|nr:Cytochrome P450 76T24 [Camellia lanceoleosa]
MEFLGYLVCSMVFLILIRGLALFRRRRTLPPGPTGLPLFGNLFEVGPKPHESLAKLAKTYGPLMTIRMGSRTSVVASSPEVAREILQKNDEACSGRIVPDAATGQKHHYLALVWISTVEQCRLIRRALSIYLTNQQKLDTLRGLRHKAVGEMIQHVRETRDRSLAIGELAFITALNMMSNTCFSVNVAGFESGEAQGFLNAVKTIMVVDGKFNIADVFPWLKPLDPQGLRTKAKVAYRWLDDVCDGFITRRLKHRESNLPSYGDLLDSLLDYSQEHHESEFNCKNIKWLEEAELDEINLNIHNNMLQK